MKNSVELSNILVKRGYYTILQVDRLSIPAGQFIGLIGPNGAGKTTFLKLCCGLIQPDQGTVLFENQRMPKAWFWNPQRYCKHIGYIPQRTEYNSNLPFTLREVVSMGRNALKPLFHPLDKTDYEKVDYWIQKMSLHEHSSQTFRSLSGGQQQKTLIARAMVAEPSVILMDEPGANLDPNWKSQFKDILSSLFEENKMTVLMVSHELDLIPESCQRLILLSKGEIIEDGSLEEIMNSVSLRNTFGMNLIRESKV